MRRQSLLKLNLFSCLYGFLLFVLTFMIFQPYRAASLLHIPIGSVSKGFFWIAILSAVIYMGFMSRLATQRPHDWKSALAVSLYAVLWFPYWLLFVLITFLTLR
ncbi:hypothetical protein [Sporolactobacillus putidus]|uniref:Uncharacterized protein n=1 Tax=Sporolactobacillus putidus TaxID=492735 RepID=A0A917W3V5_9BACL|nr:hypothetical protein [Sporolactobacillus putidus]GGL61034.1 hypothetical protein GCM10007968_26250 [Sporolactobacillus putidus]